MMRMCPSGRAAVVFRVIVVCNLIHSASVRRRSESSGESGVHTAYYQFGVAVVYQFDALIAYENLIDSIRFDRTCGCVSKRSDARPPQKRLGPGPQLLVHCSIEPPCARYQQ